MFNWHVTFKRQLSDGRKDVMNTGCCLAYFKGRWIVISHSEFLSGAIAGEKIDL
jgi:hypothetical protein